MPELGLIDYKLIRSKRKTLSLQINTNAELIIRCPQKLTIKEVESFIVDKTEWIEEKQHAVQSEQIQTPAYAPGEQFLYLGNQYPLIHHAEQTPKLDFDGKVFSLKGDGYSAFHTWYKTAFKKVALPRLDYYADLYQLNYQQVRLKMQKTLWGSCSSVNNINLNYLLIMAPMSVIDYVIVHELAHTKIKNHSKDFWQLVESMLPKYKASKSWLKEHGHKLYNL
jgi:predicted metal-dependent hydrolase